MIDADIKMKAENMNDKTEMQVIAYQDGIAQIEIPQEDLNEMIAIVRGALRLHEELLDGVQGSGLPLIDGDVLKEILKPLHAARVDPATDKAVFTADRALAVYLSTIMIAAAIRGKYEEFSRSDGTLIGTRQKNRLADQIELICMGFNPEEVIQKLEQLDNIKIPRFPGAK